MIQADDPYGAVLAARASTISSACVHAGEAPDPVTRALEVPLVLSNAFEFDSGDTAEAAFRGEKGVYIYGRWGNPSVAALEAKLAVLEGAEAACVAASGMAAISGTILAFCAEGSHVVAPRSLYGESARLFRERLPRFGITATFVDATEPEAYARAVRPETRILYMETPANPNLAITDIERVVGLAMGRGLLTILDNTFATPFAQTPLALGVDIVIHSMTKALSGHGDAIGGVVLGGKSDVARVHDTVVKGLGGALSPFNAFLIARGLRTFALRQRQACETAALLARRLSGHPAVERVHHPSLRSDPGHEVASRQMHAYGSILSFELKETSARSALELARRLPEGLRLIRHAVSLGDVRSLLIHPASTTHSTMPKEDRALAKIPDGLVRLSVGIESADDLWQDLRRGLE
jgi:methionine-gamma-lyase